MILAAVRIEVMVCWPHTKKAYVYERPNIWKEAKINLDIYPHILKYKVTLEYAILKFSVFLCIFWLFEPSIGNILFPMFLPVGKAGPEEEGYNAHALRNLVVWLPWQTTTDLVA